MIFRKILYLYAVKNNKIMESIDKEVDLRAIAQGDIIAFEQLFFQYQPRLVAFLTGLTHDREASRDLAQDLFLSLWKDRQKLDTVGSFPAYLFQMARFTVYNYFDRLLLSEKYSTDYLMKAATAESEEEALFVRELQALVDYTVNRMPPRQQQIYRMSREQNLSNDEIARHLGISRRTVENHLTAALSLLRKIIYRYLLFCTLHLLAG